MSEEQQLIGKVVVRAPEAEDDAAVVDINNRAEPEYPPLTVEELRERVASVPPGVRFDRLVAVSKGQPVGFASLYERFWSDRKGSFVSELQVDPELWGHGIGAALYEAMLASATQLGAERIYARVREDQDHAGRFAVGRGFVETGHVQRMSRLEVTRANLDGYDGLEETLANAGIEVESLAELGAEDEGVLRAVHAAQMAAVADEPTSEAVSMPFEQWRDFFVRNMPGVSAETIWVALHNREPIGTAVLKRQATNAAWNEGMGVLPEFRGRGVARLLKLRGILFAPEHGIEFMYTGNDIENPRMFDINVRLGYQPLPASIELVKELDAPPSAA